MSSRVLLSQAATQARRIPAAHTISRSSSSSAVVEQVTWSNGSAPVVPFVDGIPVAMARPITEREKNWVFWSTTNYRRNTSGGLLTVVPKGENWIIESGGRFSKVAKPGVNILLPFIHKVKAVKSEAGTTIGVLSRKAKSKGGEVDAYAVIYAKYSDLSKVAFGADGKTDGEFDLISAAQKAVADAVADVNGPLTDADRANLSAKVKAAISGKAAEVGMTIDTVEMRDAWPSSSEIPDRLVSLEKAPRPSWDHTHHLSNDYWADIMPPLFFTKFRYGNLREPETTMAPSLEWTLPSPPEFHHYHAGLPKMVIAPPEQEGKAAH